MVAKLIRQHKFRVTLEECGTYVAARASSEVRTANTWTCASQNVRRPVATHSAADRLSPSPCGMGELRIARKLSRTGSAAEIRDKTAQPQPGMHARWNDVRPRNALTSRRREARGSPSKCERTRSNRVSRS